MKKPKSHAAILICFIGASISLWLVLGEIQAPGLCPCYPGTRMPACFLIFGLYLLTGFSEFVKNQQTARILFFSCGIVGLISATFFSLSQLVGIEDCPSLLGIPLCFAAFLSFVMLLFIGSLRSKQALAVTK